MQFRGYADAAYNITNDGRSHYGYAISLGYSLISTKGGRIKTVVRSSTEAEISAVNEIASDILWCRDVLEELGYKQDPIPIMEDNKSCITMLQTELRNFHSKSRHVSKVGVLQRGVCQEDHLPTLLPNRQHGSRLVNKTSWYQSSQPPRDCNSQRFWALRGVSILWYHIILFSVNIVHTIIYAHITTWLILINNLWLVD